MCLTNLRGESTDKVVTQWQEMNVHDDTAQGAVRIATAETSWLRESVVAYYIIFGISARQRKYRLHYDLKLCMTYCTRLVRVSLWKPVRTFDWSLFVFFWKHCIVCAMTHFWKTTKRRRWKQRSQILVVFRKLKNAQPKNNWTQLFCDQSNAHILLLQGKAINRLVNSPATTFHQFQNCSYCQG